MAIVDDSDFDWLNQWKWFAQAACGGGFYAARQSSRDINGKQHLIWMHRLIVQAPHGTKVDHRNQNKLDNQRKNLRVCDSFGNAQNRVAPVTNTSGFKGVSWHMRRKKWQASIRIPGQKQKYLGIFSAAKEAALVYDYWAKKFHRDFSCLNFSKGVLSTF